MNRKPDDLSAFSAAPKRGDDLGELDEPLLPGMGSIGIPTMPTQRRHMPAPPLVVEATSVDRVAESAAAAAPVIRLSSVGKSTSLVPLPPAPPQAPAPPPSAPVPVPQGPRTIRRDVNAMRKMAEPPKLETQQDLEVDTWGKGFHIPGRFLALCGGVLVLVLPASIFLPSGKKAGTPLAPVGEYDLDPRLEKVVISTEHDLDENSQREVAGIATAYANAETLEEVLPLVREPQRVTATMQAEWEPMASAGAWEIPVTAKWTLHLTDRREYGLLRGDSADATPFRFYFVKDAGRIVLDWEATAGHSEVPYPLLSTGQSEGGLVRGFISPADFYSLALPEKEFKCYRITSPDTRTAIWAYARNESTAADQAGALVAKGNLPRKIQPEYRVTLVLRKPPSDALPNQWLLGELAHLEWVRP